MKSIIHNPSGPSAHRRKVWGAGGGLAPLDLKPGGTEVIPPPLDLYIFIRRMPKCNTVLQSENDLFEPEIQPNLHGNCEFLALIRTIKSSKCFGHCPVNAE